MRSSENVFVSFETDQALPPLLPMESFHGIDCALDLFLPGGSSVKDGTVRRSTQDVLHNARIDTLGIRECIASRGSRYAPDAKTLDIVDTVSKDEQNRLAERPSTRTANSAISILHRLGMLAKRHSHASGKVLPASVGSFGTQLHL
jgi:hypothetical protein